MDQTQSKLSLLDPPRLVQEFPILSARGLRRRFGTICAVDDVDLDAYRGEILGIVGESGSGKSTVLRILNLQEPADEGSYSLNVGDYTGLNLLNLDRVDQAEVRLQQIGIVYQNPHQGLRMSVSSGGNVAERLIDSGHRHFGRLRESGRQALSASEFPINRINDPPRQLSGGMQQRVQLAKAIALQPRLLLLDEPTTGLDVSVQALVLDTLKRLQRETKVTTIIVSHDLGVIRTLADRVLVMKNGRVVERGLADQVLDDPQHPYTQQLVHAKL